MDEHFIPVWLVRFAVAIVWGYEGFWCKLMTRSTHEIEVISVMPFFGAGSFRLALKALGVLELALAIWALSGAFPIACAAIQTVLLLALNTNGLLFARNIIHEPLGMIVRNFSFLILVWLAAGIHQ
jgi:hypothetical protein